MEQEIEALAARLIREPDPDLARRLSELLARSGVEMLSTLEPVADANPIPELVDACWDQAERAGRLPRFGPAPFAASRLERLPEVRVREVLEVRHDRGVEVARYVAWAGGDSTRARGWRRALGGGRAQPDTIGLLELLDRIRGGEVRGIGWQREEHRLVRELWEKEQADAGNPGFLRSDSHPWVRALSSGVRGPSRLPPGKETGPGNFRATRKLELPRRENPPLFRDLSREERILLLDWANAVR